MTADAKNLPTTRTSSEVVEVFFDEAHDGVSGTKLADEGRPQLYKLDHKKGKFYPLDDDTDRSDSLIGVIVRARSFYRRFGPSGIVCESDNGVSGYDNGLNKLVLCKEECPFGYHLEENIPQKCSLGLQIQMIAMLDGEPVPVQINMSATSAGAFATYLKRLNRKKLKIRGVTTKISARFIKGRHQDYYAGSFEVEDDTPCVDISGLIGNDKSQEPVDESAAEGDSE